MFEIVPISSLNDPRLAPYRTMRQQFDHFREEIFVAEGENVVLRLLESELPVISLLLPENKVSPFKALLTQKSETIPVFTAAKDVLEQLTGFQLYQGILALAKVPPPRNLDEVLRLPSPRLLIALDGVSNSENLGVVIRNAAGFGVDGLILGETCAPPYLRRSVRSSMGTIFKIPCFQPPNLVSLLRELQRTGVRVTAAHPHTHQKTVEETDLSGDCCLVFGSEGAGLSRDALSACNEAVAIPMHHGTDSLNVASASAVFLYEAQRQRSKKGASFRP